MLAFWVVLFFHHPSQFSLEITTRSLASTVSRLFIIVQGYEWRKKGEPGPGGQEPNNTFNGRFVEPFGILKFDASFEKSNISHVPCPAR